ncbi:HAS barrel domain protein [Rubidibacter lacunae KORDI 51-2]|uniref:HAS barrel domain protein n=1 Tax=Rubidibacter lacunae KORDI 51-2 TaxID=582515 RepID=U5DLM1_9CHRO|nr:HAS-barrel domain-containing protein [Rubidibacter lacunae]ERN40590.1 HAS barrel domain protein [Rubidibacter lacunae KORDI 51-2]
MRLPLPQFASDARDPDCFAEVIETATTEFLAQCLEPEELDFPAMPPFASWVKALDEESGNWVYGIVTYVTTSPIDSVHRARALGLSLSELRDQQPQIFAMLKTEFRAAIVGFLTPGDRGTAGEIFQYLPPRPPQIHQGVWHCQPEEVVSFSDRLDFLRGLLDAQGVPSEALLAAVVRGIYRLRQADRPWLVRAGREIGMLLKDDYDRLRYILSQIR